MSHLDQAFEGLGLHPREVTSVCLTHLHWDHARGVKLFSTARVFVGEREMPTQPPASLRLSQPLEMVHGGQLLKIAGMDVEIVYTPGHSAGSVSYIPRRRGLWD